jgi:NADP-dependent 3-hydroxy acid dehydrogenase YdfG
MKQVALITGSTSGIGADTARLFASKGYDLIITGRRAERLKELKKELEEDHGASVHVLNFDLKDRHTGKAALGALPAPFCNIDILVNNAGFASDMVKFQDGDLQNWDEVIDTNIKGMIYVTRHVLPGMIRRGTGHVVNIGSVAGTEPYAFGNIYAATKHAVHGLTRSLRIDLLGTGVKVTEIRPGKVETEFSLVRYKGDREAAAKVYEGYTPLCGDDIAQAVFWVVNQPANVNIDEVVLTPLSQANTYYVIKDDEVRP